MCMLGSLISPVSSVVFHAWRTQCPASSAIESVCSPALAPLLFHLGRLVIPVCALTTPQPSYVLPPMQSHLGCLASSVCALAIPVCAPAIHPSVRSDHSCMSLYVQPLQVLPEPPVHPPVSTFGLLHSASTPAELAAGAGNLV